MYIGYNADWTGFMAKNGEFLEALAIAYEEMLLKLGEGEFAGIGNGWNNVISFSNTGGKRVPSAALIQNKDGTWELFVNKETRVDADAIALKMVPMTWDGRAFGCATPHLNERVYG